VRGYWNKSDGSDIELDLIAFDETSKSVRFGSCKRSAAAHDAAALASFSGHIERFLRTGEGRRFSGWRIERALFAPLFPGEEKMRHSQGGFVVRDLRDYWHWLGLGDLPLLAAATPLAE
jgi:hypothetical protein